MNLLDKTTIKVVFIDNKKVINYNKKQKRRDKMKEAEIDYVFDLEKVIDKSNQEIETESKIEANYILDTFAKNNGLEFSKLKKAIVKKTESTYKKEKTISEPKKTTKRIVKYFIMPEKDKLEIIKQIIVILKQKGNKEVFRAIEIFEEEDLIKMGYLTNVGKTNYSNPNLKKLGLKY